MPTYFPQIHSNALITQLPYSSGQAYETIVQDVETGMCWSYARRGGTQPTGYSTSPLGKFALNFLCITDAEVATLRAFFQDRCGRLKAFRLLDPGGNLLQYSEDFSQAAWDKSSGVSILGATTDPFGKSLATRLQATTSNAMLLATVGPVDGGLDGFVVCVSAWLKAESAGQSAFLGFVDSGFAQLRGVTVPVSVGVWKRYSFTATFWDSNYFRVILGGYGTWDATVIDAYGFQCVPMKGAGAYVQSPSAYSYHPNCRFDTDTFECRALGPNQNSLVLQCLEFNV